MVSLLNISRLGQGLTQCNNHHEILQKKTDYTVIGTAVAAEATMSKYRDT